VEAGGSFWSAEAAADDFLQEHSAKAGPLAVYHENRITGVYRKVRAHAAEPSSYKTGRVCRGRDTHRQPQQAAQALLTGARRRSRPGQQPADLQPVGPLQRIVDHSLTRRRGKDRCICERAERSGRGRPRQDPRQEHTVLALQRLYEELCAAFSVGRPRRRGSGLTMSDHVGAPQKEQHAWCAYT